MLKSKTEVSRFLLINASHARDMSQQLSQLQDHFMEFYEKENTALCSIHSTRCTGQAEAGSWQSWLDDMLASVLITINKGDNR